MLLLIKQSLPLKNPPGEEANVFALLLQFRCLMAWHKAGLRDPGHSIGCASCPPTHPFGSTYREQLSSCCPSWDGLGWEGDSSARVHIPKYHLLCSHRKPLQLLSSSTWGGIIQTRKPDWQVSLLWDAESGALPLPSNCCWGQQHKPHGNLSRTCLGLEQSQGRENGVTPHRGTEKLGDLLRQSYCSVLPTATWGSQVCYPTIQSWAASRTEVCLLSADPKIMFAAVASSFLVPAIPPCSAGCSGVCALVGR